MRSLGRDKLLRALGHAIEGLLREGDEVQVLARSRSAYHKALAACQRRSIRVDLARPNPAGVDRLLAATSGPLSIWQTTPHPFDAIARTSSAAHIREVKDRIHALAAALNEHN